MRSSIDFLISARDTLFAGGAGISVNSWRGTCSVWLWSYCSVTTCSASSGDSLFFGLVRRRQYGNSVFSCFITSRLISFAWQAPVARLGIGVGPSQAYRFSIPESTNRNDHGRFGPPPVMKIFSLGRHGGLPLRGGFKVKPSKTKEVHAWNRQKSWESCPLVAWCWD